jgi:peptidoglycan L-alanyl-D-glutamate endopeptidase CwlK
MPKFSQISEDRLSSCHKDLKVLFRHVIQDYDCTIICGARNEEDQNKAFAEGKSKLQWPNSLHNRNPSWATDAAPYINGKIDWSSDNVLIFAGYVKGIADQLFRTGVMTHRIRIGADFNQNKDVTDDNFKDKPHFELIPNGSEK